MLKVSRILKAKMVFHGSPFEFEIFKLHHIGTGEGTQAFGWGLYFTETQEIAEYYRKYNYNQTGTIYEVDIPDGPFLMWDKTIEDQPILLKIMNNLKIEITTSTCEYGKLDLYVNGEWQGYSLSPSLTDMTGELAYHLISRLNGGDKSASLLLYNMGLKGIQYFDAFSREGRARTFNYVLFNDKDVKLVKKSI